MKIKGLVAEDFTNYKLPSMFVLMPWCDGKCNREFGSIICQNEHLNDSNLIDLDVKELINMYLSNDISKAVVFGGREPFDSWSDLFGFIVLLRKNYNCDDPIVIYTGYNESEINDKIMALSGYKNIIVKFGRFIPNKPNRYDEVLGVWLASDNQRAVQIS